MSPRLRAAAFIVLLWTLVWTVVGTLVMVVIKLWVARIWMRGSREYFFQWFIPEMLQLVREYAIVGAIAGLVFTTLLAVGKKTELPQLSRFRVFTFGGLSGLLALTALILARGDQNFMSYPDIRSTYVLVGLFATGMSSAVATALISTARRAETLPTERTADALPK